MSRSARVVPVEERRAFFDPAAELTAILGTTLTSRGVPILLEWDPKALASVGDRGKIQEVANREYGHFSSMRADPAIDGPKLWLRPVDELENYAERFLDGSRSESFTELFRLASDQVPDDELFGVIDMSTVIKRQAKLRAEIAAPSPMRRLGRRVRSGLGRLLLPVRGRNRSSRDE